MIYTYNILTQRPRYGLRSECGRTALAGKPGMLENTVRKKHSLFIQTLIYHLGALKLHFKG